MKKMLKTWTKAALLAVMATFLLAGFPACSDGSDDDPRPVMHTVTFVSDGSPVTQQVEHGKKATELAAPTKDGYTFSGWYFGDTAFDFDTPITGDITLTAQWERVPCEVYKTENGAKLTIYEDGTFEYTDADGNSSKGTYETATDGTITGTFTDGPLADPNSEFKATKTADGSISATVGGKELEFSPEDDDQEPVMHTVTFVSDGSPVPPQTVEHGKKATEPTTPTKDGYTFSGWYFGDTAFDFDTPITDDITLTAQWKRDNQPPTTIPVTSVSLNEKNVTVMVNKTVTLVATVNPANATNQAMTWESNNEKVATVDEDGTVTGRSEGTARITVTTADGNHTDSCEVTVSTPAPTSSYLIIEATDDGGWAVTSYYTTLFPDNGEVKIPEGVTTIGNSAFYDCSSLTSVEIPDSVTTIGERAFSSCWSLTSVEIPKSVTTIGERAFGGCGLASVTIDKGVTTIGESMFEECSKLESVNIPEGVTAIGERAFYNCKKLESVEIPKSVTDIGEFAFYSCGLERVTIGAVTTIGESVFSACSALASVTIDKGVTTIGERMFDNCSSLASVNIPDSVTTIGEYAFYGCGLESVTIGKGVTTIDKFAFQNCPSLERVTISAGVTTIGDSMFSSCPSLVSVEIPNSVTNIGERAFQACSSLARVEIPGSVTTIGKNAFLRCGLESVTIDKGVTTIGESMFEECSKLASVEIPDSVTTIGKSAFESCSSLASVNIPDSVTNINESAFENCSKLASVTTVEGVTTIGAGVTNIGERAFYSCALTSVEIPDSVTTIGGRAFQNCSSLESVTFKDTEGWYYNYTTFGFVDVTNSGENARQFRSTFIGAWGNLEFHKDKDKAAQ